MSKQKKIAIAIVSFFLFGWLALSLSSGIFLWSIGLDPNDAGLMILYQYWYHYKDHETIINKVYAAGAFSLAAAFLPGLLIAFQKTAKAQFGDARQADRADLKKAGLFEEREPAVLLGKVGDDYLMHSGEMHVTVQASSRDEKTASAGIPNYLIWPHSIFGNDPKEECWNITSGYRSQFQPCYKYNPLSPTGQTHQHNPLMYVSDDPYNRISDLQMIASFLIPDEGSEKLWTATPRNLFIGIGLYLFETPGKIISIGQILRETLQKEPPEKYFAKVIEAREKAGSPLSAECVRLLYSFINIESDKTRAGMLATFWARLELWQNPLIDAATTGHDYDFRDMRKKKMSVYFVFDFLSTDALSSLINLTYQMFLKANTTSVANDTDTYKYSVLNINDELSNLGPIPKIMEAPSFVAGYNIRMLSIIQSYSSLIDIYGKAAAKAFRINNLIQIIYPPKMTEIEDVEQMAKWFGTETIKRSSETRKTGIYLDMEPIKTINESEAPRPLFLPQEILSLPFHQQILAIRGMPPAIVEKTPYYKDSKMLARLKTACPYWNQEYSKDMGAKKFEAMMKKCTPPVPTIDLNAHAARIKASQAGELISTAEMKERISKAPKMSATDVEEFSIKNTTGQAEKALETEGHKLMEEAHAE